MVSNICIRGLSIVHLEKCDKIKWDMDEHFTQDTFKFFQHLLQNTTTYSPLCGDVLGKGSICLYLK